MATTKTSRPQFVMRGKYEIELVRVDGLDPHYRATGEDGAVLTSKTAGGIYDLVARKEAQDKQK